jgi:peptide/nickel transport system substrate-binding protein
MSDHNNGLGRYLNEDLFNKSMSRRSVLRNGVLVGLTVPVAASILAACETDDDVADDTAVEEPDDDEPATEPVDDDTDDEEEDVAEEPDDTDDDDDVEEPEETDDDVAVDSDHESLFGDDYEEPQNQGGQIVEGAFSDAATLNGILTQDTASSRVISMITKSVIGNHPITTEPIPELAEDWDITDDGLEYTFNLREDVTWHDGEQFTADDVVYTFETHMHEETGSPRTSELTARIDTVEAVDDYTVQFTLNFPSSPFLQQNMVYYIVPEHILGDVAPADLASHDYSIGTQGVTIGCGPFQFVEWVSDDHITLEAYEDYYEGAPNIDRWIRRIVPDQTVLAQQVITGEVDYGAIQESDYDNVDQQDHIDVTEFDTFNFTFYSYQLNSERSTLFQEPEVRQALVYGLDRESMVQAIRFGIGEVAIGTMPIPSWAYDPGSIDRQYEYDPDRAREMLEEAGWVEGADGIRERDGERFSFEIYTNAGNEIREQYVAVMQEQWREIGVECTPQTEEWSTFLDRITGTRDFDMFLVGFSWGVDPHQETMWHTDASEGGFNMNEYSNPEVDDLLAQGLETTDQDERRELYTQMQNILMEDLPSVILDFPQGIYGVNQRCHNIFPNDVHFTANAHEWWVDE